LPYQNHASAVIKWIIRIFWKTLCGEKKNSSENSRSLLLHPSFLLFFFSPIWNMSITKVLFFYQNSSHFVETIIRKQYHSVTELPLLALKPPSDFIKPTTPLYELCLLHTVGFFSLSIVLGVFLLLLDIDSWWWVLFFFSFFTLFFG
jgi:hypothetical protein